MFFDKFKFVGIHIKFNVDDIAGVAAAGRCRCLPLPLAPGLGAGLSFPCVRCEDLPGGEGAIFPHAIYSKKILFFLSTCTDLFEFA